MGNLPSWYSADQPRIPKYCTGPLARPFTRLLVPFAPELVPLAPELVPLAPELVPLAPELVENSAVLDHSVI